MSSHPRITVFLANGKTQAGWGPVRVDGDELVLRQGLPGAERGMKWRRLHRDEIRSVRVYGTDSVRDVDPWA